MIWLAGSFSDRTSTLLALASGFSSSCCSSARWPPFGSTQKCPPGCRGTSTAPSAAPRSAQKCCGRGSPAAAGVSTRTAALPGGIHSPMTSELRGSVLMYLLLRALASRTRASLASTTRIFQMPLARRSWSVVMVCVTRFRHAGPENVSVRNQSHSMRPPPIRERRSGRVGARGAPTANVVDSCSPCAAGLGRGSSPKSGHTTGSQGSPPSSTPFSAMGISSTGGGSGSFQNSGLPSGWKRLTQPPPSMSGSRARSPTTSSKARTRKPRGIDAHRALPRSCPTATGSSPPPPAGAHT
mmetsp:Transcript_5971/g.16027  ORF Transcript_5971/g.16027 Transcript_5971/m.16027 type:complete len:297 (-) Transcript_5971:94-984(-)